MRSSRLGSLWVGVVAGCLLASASAIAPAACDRECDDVTPWAGFTAIDLTLTFPGRKDVQKWHAEVDRSTKDLRVDVDSVVGNEANRGSIGMIEGRTMIVRGVKVERGYEIDALDGPVLTMRLLLALLARTVPDGPDAVKDTRRIDFSEPRIGIRFATASAEGNVTAPWRVVGSVGKPGAGAIAYDFHLTGGTGDATGAGEPIDMMLSGRLAMRQGAVYEDGMSLAGWQLYGVGPREGTVADVRAALKEKFDPRRTDR